MNDTRGKRKQSPMMSPAHCRTEARLRVGENADSVCLLGRTRILTGDDDDGGGDETVAKVKQQSIVIGTYALQQSDHRRLGGLHVLHATATATAKTAAAALEDDGEQEYAYCLESASVHESAAVLDVTCVSDQDVCYAACADNSVIRARALRDDSVVCSKVDEGDGSDTLILSLHVIKQDEDGDSLLMATSDSKGMIKLQSVHNNNNDTNNGSEDVEIDRRKMHDCEAWTTHIMTGSSGTKVLSGGDDGLLTSFTVNDPQPNFRKRHAHSGVGVTCIGSSPSPHMFWTGGYDDCLRVWDVRNMKDNVWDVGVGGGVWRIKFHPSNPNLALVAAMYDGCKVVRLDDGGLTVVGQYGKDEHESMVYGAEWLHGLDNNDSHVAVTASFYDNGVRLWSFS